MLIELTWGRQSAPDVAGKKFWLNSDCVFRVDAPLLRDDGKREWSGSTRIQDRAGLFVLYVDETPAQIAAMVRGDAPALRDLVAPRFVEAAMRLCAELHAQGFVSNAREEDSDADRALVSAVDELEAMHDAPTAASVEALDAVPASPTWNLRHAAIGAVAALRGSRAAGSATPLRADVDAAIRQLESAAGVASPAPAISPQPYLRDDDGESLGLAFRGQRRR